MGTGASVDSNTPDKYSGLTKRQKKVIRSIWKNVEKNVETHSVKFFIRFFEKYPTYKKYFVSKTGGSMTQVAENAHAQSRFRAIVCAISNLIKTVTRRPKRLESRLTYIAMLHKGMGLNMTDFGNFRDVLVNYLKQEFPKNMTMFEISAWTQFLSSMFRRICTIMDDIEEDTTLDEVVKSKTTKLGRLLTSTKKKNKEKEFWRDRRNFWKMQREIWRELHASEDEQEDADDEADWDDEEDGEGKKGIHIQLGEAVATFVHSLNPDAEATAKVSVKNDSGNKEKITNTLPRIEDIPLPYEGFARRGSQAPRPNAGNTGPRPSVSPKPPNSIQPPREQTNGGCLICSPARARRRKSFEDTYHPPV